MAGLTRQERQRQEAVAAHTASIIRLHELHRLARDRFGNVLPDNDEGREMAKVILAAIRTVAT
jgi:hypothetical protein